MWACEHENVTPDLLCTAKGLAGGYLPLAATLSTDEIYNVFLGEYSALKTFFHGHTFTGNPLACAVALENIAIFEREELLARLQISIKTFQKPAPGILCFVPCRGCACMRLNRRRRIGKKPRYTYPLSVGREDRYPRLQSSTCPRADTPTACQYYSPNAAVADFNFRVGHST